MAAVLTSDSLHDSQVEIPLMQKVSERATVFYDLADSAYDADDIKSFSKNWYTSPSSTSTNAEVTRYRFLLLKNEDIVNGQAWNGQIRI